MVGPCTTATTFSSSGLQVEGHRCSQPTKNLFPSRAVPPQLLPVLPATAAGEGSHSRNPQHSSPSQRAEPRMTERSVSQQVSMDTAVASSNKPAVSKQRVTITPNIWVGDKCSRPTASHLGLDRTPALSICSGGRCPPASQRHNDEWECRHCILPILPIFNVARVPLIATRTITLNDTPPPPLHSLSAKRCSSVASSAVRGQRRLVICSF